MIRPIRSVIAMASMLTLLSSCGHEPTATSLQLESARFQVSVLPVDRRGNQSVGGYAIDFKIKNVGQEPIKVPVDYADNPVATVFLKGSNKIVSWHGWSNDVALRTIDPSNELAGSVELLGLEPGKAHDEDLLLRISVLGVDSTAGSVTITLASAPWEWP